MSKKEKYKKIQASMLIELSLPDELLKSMKTEDRRRLEDLNRLDMRWKAGSKTSFIFHLGDIHKINSLLRNYGYVVRYPDKKELKKYGLTYSGDSIDIAKSADNFIITQTFPDGRVETHIIPEKRVWRVFYVIKHYFEKTGEEKVVSSKLWRDICVEFGLTRYIDRYGQFHANSFMGQRRTYFDFYYYPVKVLQQIGKIRYEGKYIYNPEGGVSGKKKK